MNKGKVVNFFDFLQNLKLCGFYMFQKEYLDEFVEKKIIRIYCQQIEELEEEEEEDEGMKQLEIKLDEMKQLEMKLEKMMCKMNIVIVCLAIVVLAAVVKSVV